MKSLILKDLYNMGSSMRSTLFILVFFVITFIPNAGVEGFIGICAIICSRLIVSTFTFDEYAKWNQYALIMPVSKKELVKSKFMMLFIFSAGGALLSLLLGTAGGILLGKLTLQTSEIWNLLLVTLMALVIALVFGSISIPIVLKFGVENARILLLISYVIPLAIVFATYKFVAMAGIEMMGKLERMILCAIPILAMLFVFAMYKISCYIFEKQDIQ